jgi:hypothetical protein
VLSLSVQRWSIVRRVAVREYNHLNPEPTRARQDLLTKLVTAMAVRMQAPNISLLEQVVKDALAATEDLALRSGFFVGMAHGAAWGMNFEDEMRKHFTATVKR